MIPQEFLDKYNLQEKSHNVYIYARVTKGMYGLPHDALVKHLEPYVCHPLIKTPLLCTHNSWPINFTLVVDNFGVKYLVKYHALHLKSALEDKYKVTIDWEGTLYIGIALKWNYEKGTVQISITGYVRASIHSFQHKKTQNTPGITIPLDTTHLCEKQSDAIRKIISWKTGWQ